MSEPTGCIEQVLGQGVLKLRTSTGWYIDIESSLYVTDPGGTVHDAVGRESDTCQIVASWLLGQEIVAVNMSDRDGLWLSFASGTELAVPPDLDFESWSVVGPKQEMVVAMPGGELAIWGPNDEVDTME